ncbi:hypothetical protein ccbrp13_52260 [Ktedonobacteria bacterium brp13]|nr:hypothetical protein ccbrp13_52260 [Ktedonobacteria bacterium brp13]
MKVHIAHDVNGNIIAAMTPEPEFKDKVGIKPSSDERIVIIDRPDLTGQDLVQHLREIRDQYRIDTQSGTLVQK